MIRALPFVILLTACGSFPQVDAAAPKTLPAKPAFLSPAEVEEINAQAQDLPKAAPAEAESDLQDRAEALRNR